jgi:hypothetical protein
VREEGQDVLPEDSTPWAKELPSPTSHSNRSPRTEVSVAGKRNFHARDKEAETALEIQGRRRRDKISLGNPVDSELIAGFREISVRTRMRGGGCSQHRTSLLSEFPANREIYREFFVEGGALAGSSRLQSHVIPMICSKIPYAVEQGIFLSRTGNWNCRTGKPSRPIVSVHFSHACFFPLRA